MRESLVPFPKVSWLLPVPCRHSLSFLCKNSTVAERIKLHRADVEGKGHGKYRLYPYLELLTLSTFYVFLGKLKFVTN